MSEEIKERILKEEVIVVDGGGQRKNEGKLPVDLVPVSAILALAKVLDAGQKKYSARNWERSMKWSICYACAMRHLLKWWNGEDNDEETGLSHLYHALCNIAFLIEYLETAKNQDDRPRRNKGV